MPQSTGTLFVVATPIGNLEDLTFRGLEVLREVDLIAAEDTRRTRILLSHYRIPVNLISYREQNRNKSGPRILSHLMQGRSVALVTDAGTPGLSDPGYHLVGDCVDNGIRVVPIPGANALGAALCVAGMSLDRFLFEGFLPSRPTARKNRIAQIGAAGVPFIIFESPKRILDTLRDIVGTLGDRDVVLAREMTKVHEEFLRGKAADMIQRLGNDPILGEITLVVAGSMSPGINLNILEGSKRLLKEGIPPSRVAGVLSELTGVDRRAIYRIVTGLTGEKDKGGNHG